MRKPFFTFFLQDIRRNLLNYLVILIQIILAAVVLCYALTLAYNGWIATKKFEKLNDRNSIYKLSSDLEESEMDELTNSEAKAHALYRLIRDMYASDSLECVTADDSMDFTFGKHRREYAGLPEKLRVPGDQTVSVDMAVVSSNFFRFFGIKGKYDMSSERNRRPLILGNAFRKYYRVGDVIHDSVDDEYVVKGFLPKGAYYVNPFEKNEPFYLDRYFVASVCPQRDDGIGSFITVMSTFVVEKKKGALHGMMSRESMQTLGFLYTENYTEEIRESVTDILNSVMTMASIAIIILLFCSIGLIANLLHFMESSMKEFAVNMLCGARLKDIILRLTAQVGSMIVIAGAVTLLVWKFSGPAVATLLTLAVYAFIALAYPVWQLKKIEIIEIIRRK
ncbi:hypothetical protein BHK98_08485 [Hornefia porci]|uniref:Uncharacterized protein n=2 Tax=Hornefia porci TaxID=2652292 RepID=A0A1Q9JIY8_9FIRM|nr:hypothetical protein BHK98_08485 [Hornefia porci]